MDQEGNVRLAHSAPGILQDRGWDRMIYVTDLPLTTRRPVISQSVENGRATMLCLPAFGLLRARDALRQEMTRLVKACPQVREFRKPKSQKLKAAIHPRKPHAYWRGEGVYCASGWE